MISFLWTLASFIIALGILVAVHEWGHFYVARRCGVKVERFSIGFGRPLWRTYDRQGTEYVIAAIPLGGYVKMLDERVDQVKEDDLPHAFNRQNVYKRIAIIAAGPLVNFLFAIFALFIMYMIGKDAVKPVIGEVAPDSFVARANIQNGAEIISIGGRETPDWQAVNLELISHIGKSELVMEARQRSGVRQQFSVDIEDWKFDPDKASAITSLGMTPFRPKVKTSIHTVSANSAADSADIRVGDKIVALEGTPVENWEQIVEYVAQRPDQQVEITLQRDGQTLDKQVTIGSTERDGQVRGLLGVIPESEPWPESYVFTHQYGPIPALVTASQETWRLMTLSVEMLGKLLTGDVSLNNLSGPISIAQGAGISAGYGLVYFLSFLALISVNLGIINLLPLPVLDGGHLLYYFIELLTGRPVPESVQEVGFRIGGVLLLVIMTIAIVNDITRL